MHPGAVDLYFSLNAREKAEFRAFAESPFVNRRKKLLLLLRVITQQEAEKPWDREKVFHSVFGKDAFNALRLNNLLSDLYKLEKKFLAWKQFEKSGGQREVLLLEKLIEKDSRKPVEQILRQSAQGDSADSETHFKRSRLADQYYFSHSRKQDNAFLLQSSEGLELYYLQSQLRTWCELLNRSHILSLEYPEEPLARFLDYLSMALPVFGKDPVIALYHPILQWLLHPGEDAWFAEFRKIVMQHVALLPPQEARDIVSYMQNYCVKRINEGRMEYLSEWIRMVKELLPMHLLEEGGYLSQWTYKNIVTAGLRLKDFTWTESFIHSQYENLAPETRDNAYQYNLAVFYYESGDMQRAMQWLNKVHFTDPNYYLDARSILLKIYFAQEAQDALISLRDSVRVYLLRDKLLSREQKQLYKNLFLYTWKLFRLQFESAHLRKDERENKIRLLEKEFATQKLIANRQWLAEKFGDTLKEITQN